MLYSSVENKKIKQLKKLKTKKYRDLFNMFLIEGKHIVLEAYKKGCLKEVLINDTNLDLDIETNYMNESVMKYLSDTESGSKIIGVANKMDGEVLGNKIVYLDNIQDPGNLGTIIRSCVAFNVDTLVLSKNTVDLYNPKVIRASEGMLFHLNIVIMDINDLVLNIKDKDFKIYGTKVDSGKSLKSIEKDSKFVIIMGNEGAGISAYASKFCTDYIYINMNKACESLNVGVATSIILYELDK